ncbi:unnamed protein product [Adineta ricciae]|uniref:FZ domain-containing protein n=1 Tax=Adineta ricciae TaxID=249248 RepID=A0A815B1F9_ADIRI|nr:unnamed protein product [Adineta ricciae]CAF1261722.1 unnamed protein product [Adineta ricciae]
MSVLLVTDDNDDGIQIPKQHDHLYQQIKELEYNYSPFDSIRSIVRRKYSSYRQRRRSRPQRCLAKTLFTYMLTLLFLTNHLHWSIMFFSFSSIKFTSTYALPNAKSAPQQSPSITKGDEQQCLPISAPYIDRICSRTCRARMSPIETTDNMNQVVSSSRYLPFCSNHTLGHSINQNYLDNNLDESQCRQMFEEIIRLDEEARKAHDLFVTYLKAIDSASDENRYSIIDDDCQEAYRTWTCSVKIPYFHQNQLIPPCQKICDEVERVCPTFRPSDREPLFAGQPLFFCNGGIVTNSNYGHRPHCFDTCHLTDDLSQRHSISSTTLPSSKASLAMENLEINAGASSCFEIRPIVPSSIPPDLSLLSLNESISNYTRNASTSGSALSIISSAYSSILVNLLTFIFVLLSKILQEYSS